jgi:hypothetical protein
MSLFRSGGDMASCGVAGGDVGVWPKPCRGSAIFSLAGSSCLIPSNEDHCRMNCTSLEYSPHFVSIWKIRNLQNFLMALCTMCLDWEGIPISTALAVIMQQTTCCSTRNKHTCDNFPHYQPRVHNQSQCTVKTWQGLDICELQCLGFWPFIITHFNITTSTFHDWLTNRDTTTWLESRLIWFSLRCTAHSQCSQALSQLSHFLCFWIFLYFYCTYFIGSWNATGVSHWKWPPMFVMVSLVSNYHKHQDSAVYMYHPTCRLGAFPKRAA